MPDVTGGDEDLDLSIAYRALERRRDDFVAKRERITDELAKLDAVLEALRELRDIEPELAAINGSHQAAPAAPEAGEQPAPAAPMAGEQPAPAAPGAGELPAPRPAERPMKGADRRIRIVELLLENPRRWFTASEVAGFTEPGKATPTQRNAVSEALRRLLRQGAVERDESVKPAKYRAIPAALREILLAHE